MNSKESSKARVVAFYLPQFHPIPENDQWWGKGFTEWTNVGRAKSLFKGHYQPRVPADLGYYNLCQPEIREAQAEMARYAGVEGFAYWHYWFAGKRLLERPFNEVLKSGSPSLPFCLAWANETWSGVWNNDHKRILVEQTYPGKEDHIAHFQANLDAFRDERYIRIDGKLLFLIYKPLNLPDAKSFIDLWNDLAHKNGLNGFYFVGVTNKPLSETDEILELGFDAVNVFRVLQAKNEISGFKRYYSNISDRFFNGAIGLNKFDYQSIIGRWIKEDDEREEVLPCIFPNWDNSPRSGRRALIIHKSTPELFEEHMKSMMNLVEKKQNKLLFLKSWNEWAEGNYVEPDLKYGNAYLEVLRKYLVSK
ncbi:glycosyltransferase WbsX family protein [Pararcticibacter amylolyticus]|nr:glycoside hydrolase family 99-like domain-containing protein [Pararcticibacter amylolyticus]